MVFTKRQRSFHSTLGVCVFVQKVDEEVELEKGSHVRVVTAESDKDKTDGKIIWVDYPSLPKVLKKGGNIYIDDGLIGLKVLEIGNALLSAEVGT